MIIKKAAFLGGAEFREGDKEYAEAFETAKLLAQKKALSLVSGEQNASFATGHSNHAKRRSATMPSAAVESVKEGN